MNTFKFTIRAMVVCLIAVYAAKSEGQTLLQTISNSVADGTLVMDHSRSDWNGLTPYNADPNEGSNQDWSVGTIANDSSNFYFRYQFNATDGLDTNVMIFLDTDNSRSTGFIGGGSQLAIGAEFMIQGVSIYSYAGTSTDWAWNYLGGVNYDTSVTDDFEFSMARSTIGSVASFSLEYLAQGNISGAPYDDYYPDSGNGGTSGGYFAYTTVPEPGTNMLILGGLGILVGGGRYLRRRQEA